MSEEIREEKLKSEGIVTEVSAEIPEVISFVRQEGETDERFAVCLCARPFRLGQL